MTNRITITAADVQVGDLIYDGPGANARFIGWMAWSC